MEEIKDIIQQYIHSIHTQNKDDFYAFWAKEHICSLISITYVYQGLDSIYQDFLINRIQQAYSTIDLIAENVDIRMIDDNHAIAIFSYHTECIRRDTNEEYGIKGLETQIFIKEDQWKLLHVHYSK